MTRLTVLVSLLMYFALTLVCGESLPRGTVVDERVKVLVFNPNQVYKLVAFYGYQIDLQLAENEEVRTLAAGDTVGWQIVSSGHHIFIKPMASGARTNLSVVTSRRTYIFDLNSRSALDRADMTYLVRFKYPEADADTLRLRTSANTYAPTFNFQYKVAGSKKIQPAHVFDDGSFTYFQFEPVDELPAIFVVGSDGKESLVNYRMEGSTVVVERLGEFYTLRSGKETATAINENRLGKVRS